MKSKFNWPGLWFSVALIALWEALSHLFDSPSFPSVMDVLKALVEDAPVLLSAIGVSMLRALVGFALVLVIMLPLGIFLGRTPKVARYVEPILDVLRPLPPLAIVPVAMLFAGTGDLAKIAVIFYSASFPLLINAIDATRSTHPLMIHVARSTGLSRSEIMRQIDFPAALPQMMLGIRQSVSLALLIGISSEMLLSTNGLGNYLMRMQEQFLIANGLAGLLVIAAVSLIVSRIMLHLERHLLAWHHLRFGMAKV